MAFYRRIPQIRRTSADNPAAPTGLADAQFDVEYRGRALDTRDTRATPKLWTGVPITINANRRVQLYPLDQLNGYALLASQQFTSPQTAVGTRELNDRTQVVATVKFCGNASYSQWTAQFVNRIRNGLFTVWQRGGLTEATALPLAPAGAYTADGWITSCVSGTLGKVWCGTGSGPGNDYSQRHMVIQGGVGVLNVSLTCFIESAIAVHLGERLCLFQCKIDRDTAPNFTPYLYVYNLFARDTMTGSSETLIVDAALQPLTAAGWTSLGYAFEMPASTANGLMILLDFGVNTLNGAGRRVRISEVSLRPIARGSMPAGLADPALWGLQDYIPEPRRIDDELTFCRRYFWRPPTPIVIQASERQGVMQRHAYYSLPTQMRVTPTLTASIGNMVNCNTPLVVPLADCQTIHGQVAANPTGTNTSSFDMTIAEASAEII